MKEEYVMIASWPVQFLPPTGPLVEEALAEAVEADVEGRAPWTKFERQFLSET